MFFHQLRQSNDFLRRKLVNDELDQCRNLVVVAVRADFRAISLQNCHVDFSMVMNSRTGSPKRDGVAPR